MRWTCLLLAGIIAGLGGSMIRDVLLGLEAAAIENWHYIPAVLVAAFVGGFRAHRIVQGHSSFLLAQGVAVGLLVTIGVQKGVTWDGDYPRSCRTEAGSRRPVFYVGGLADDGPVQDHRGDAAEGADVVQRVPVDEE